MATTIRDAQEAVMEGRAKWQQFKDEFQKKWVEPDEDLAMARIWKQLPAAIRDAVREINPKNYNEMQRKYGGE